MACFGFLSAKPAPTARKISDTAVERTILLQLTENLERDVHSYVKELDEFSGVTAVLRAAGAPGMTKESTLSALGCSDRTSGYTHVVTIIANDFAGLQKCVNSTAHAKLEDVFPFCGQPIVVDASLSKALREQDMPKEDKDTALPVKPSEEPKKIVNVLSRGEIQDYEVTPSSPGGFFAPVGTAPAVVYRGSANSVVARGEWDNWAADLVLSKKTSGDWHADLPSSWNGMMYKFVVDGVWMVDDAQPTKPCGSGHMNNYWPGYNEKLRSSSRPRRADERRR